MEGEWNRELISKTAKEIDPDVGCVIACIDYYVSYIKTLKAVTYLNNPEVIFLTTNLEDRHSYQNGIISPGEGAFAQFLATASSSVDHMSFQTRFICRLLGNST